MLYVVLFEQGVTTRVACAGGLVGFVFCWELRDTHLLQLARKNAVVPACTDMCIPYAAFLCDHCRSSWWLQRRTWRMQQGR